MKGKKAFPVLFCLLALILSLALPALSAGATPTVYLLSLNDKMVDLPGGLRPMSINGSVYVPYSAFDRTASGVDLGVYYGIDSTQGITLTLYSRNAMLVFRVNQGTCEDGQGNRMGFRCWVRNNTFYMPAAAICDFFGLHYANMATADRGTLIRLTSEKATMSDEFFLSSAGSAMAYRYYNAIQALTGQAPTSAAPTPSAAPVPTPTPTPSREELTVYLALDLSECEDSGAVARLEGLPLLILLTPDTLLRSPSLVRKLWAKGFSLGWKVSGTAEEALEELNRGNDLLAHLVRGRTRIVWASRELQEELTRQGWLCWRPNMTDSGITSNLNQLEKRRTTARLTLSGAPGDLTNAELLIRRLHRDERYALREPVETDLGGG